MDLKKEKKVKRGDDLDNKGNISLAFFFAIIFIMLSFMFIVLAPALQTYTARIFLAGEPLIDDANTISSGFSDAQVKSIYRESLQGQKDSFAVQQEVLGTLTTYAWLFILILAAFIFLIYSRFLVERSTGGAV